MLKKLFSRLKNNQKETTENINAFKESEKKREESD